MADFVSMTVDELETQLVDLNQQILATREVKRAAFAALEKKVIAERQASLVEGFAELPPGVRDAVVQAIAAQAEGG